MQLMLFIAGNNHRLTPQRQGIIITRFGNLAFMGEKYPVTFEDMLHFKFKQLRVGKYRPVAAVNMIFTIDN